MAFKQRPNINPKYGWTHQTTTSKKEAEAAVRRGKGAGIGVYVEPRKKNGKTIYYIYTVGQSPY